MFLLSRLRILPLLACVFVSSSMADEGPVIIEQNSPVTQGEALSEDVGIEMWGGTLNPIIFMGCELPCEQSQVFATADESQIDMSIKLVRGKSKNVQDGTYLGTYRISGLVPADNGRTTLDVIFGASKGNLWLSAKDINGLSNIKITKLTH